MLPRSSEVLPILTQGPPQPAEDPTNLMNKKMSLESTYRELSWRHHREGSDFETLQLLRHNSHPTGLMCASGYIHGREQPGWDRHRVH